MRLQQAVLLNSIKIVRVCKVQKKYGMRVIIIKDYKILVKYYKIKENDYCKSYDFKRVYKCRSLRDCK